MAWRISLSMQMRNAARVLPDPVGAEMRVGRPSRIGGHPNSWGEVGLPNLLRNHSCTTGWAQASASQLLNSRTLDCEVAIPPILSRVREEKRRDFRPGCPRIFSSTAAG